MRTALLVTSFGTTHLDTLEKTILATEQALAAAFPEYPVYRAFTSAMVRKGLRERYQISVYSIDEALSQIAADGFERVIVQPTLLIPGAEYEKLCASVYKNARSLKTVIGHPLMKDASDLEEVINILQDSYPVDEDTVLLLMGHGTEHSANRLYEDLAAEMRKKGGNMRLCTVEGTPSFENALSELSAMTQRKIKLAPLLFVAGDHTKNDMAGDEPDSLRSQLTAAGFEVECVLRGLGELPGVQQFLARRIIEVLE